MKILIIGSKGFIGSHCVTYFMQQHQVWECDVVTDYNNENYFLIEVTNADYSEIFEQQKFDVCINCSGAANVPDSIKNPQRDFTLNTVNVFKQLDAIRKHNPTCKYVNISSAAVYGNPETLPIRENQSLSPISPYGKHKKMAEDICEEFYSQFGIKTCSLRVFSAYGIGLKKQLFWDLYQKQKTTNNIVLYGTGKESRDFIEVTDLVYAIDCVIQNGIFNGEFINVANGEELTIEQVTKIFYSNINPSAKVTFAGENRKGDPVNWLANIEKLTQLGYSKKVNIEKGLTKYIEWLKEQE